jgi:hypothetical protein
MKFLKSRGVVVAAFVLILYVAGSLMGQLQQSGGLTISGALPAGSNIIGKVGIDQSTPGTTNGVQVVAALPTGSNTIGAISNASFAITGALPAGTNVIGTVNTIQKTACGNTVASQALAAVPTSATAVFSSTTCIEAMVINNTNSSAATVTITDNQGTPVNNLLTFSIPANSQIIEPLWGIAFTSGVKWTASTSGLTGGMVGYQ